MALVSTKIAQENFPKIGTVLNPAVFSDGEEFTYLAYEIAPKDGRGYAILRFRSVVEFRNTPLTVESKHRYRAKPWEFNEIIGAPEVEEWRALAPRFWIISFNDVTIEVLFEQVELVQHEHASVSPAEALKSYIQT